MQEHELKEYQRLRAEGHWTAASKFREAERKRLRAAGHSRHDAREESWEAMLEKYPPQDGQTPSRQSAEELDRWSEADAAYSESQLDEHNRDAEIAEELKQLVLLTNSQPTDLDRDINFAYRNMAFSSVMPLTAPSGAAWQWYLYARREPAKFLEICAKREDAKAKQAGTITNQRMEDDKRQQFAILDRIEKQLTLDVRGMVKDLMDKFPREVLRECRKYSDAWKSFLAEECQ
jgi:hypothetical protein